MAIEVEDGAEVVGDPASELQQKVRRAYEARQAGASNEEISELLLGDLPDESKAEFYMAAQLIVSASSGVEAAVAAYEKIYGVASDETTHRCVTGLAKLASSLIQAMGTLGFNVHDMLGGYLTVGEGPFLERYADVHGKDDIVWFDDKGDVVEPPAPTVDMVA